MRRYLSLSKSDGARASVITTDTEKAHLTGVDEDPAASSTTVQAPPAPLAPPQLKVKRVDHFYSRWSRKLKYENSGSNVIPELRSMPGAGEQGNNDPWQQFCFVVVREIPREQDKEPYFKVHIKSPYLLTACKKVIQDVQGVSWNAIPVALDPQLLLAFLPQFQKYTDDLHAQSKRTEEETYISQSIDVLIEYLRKDYRATVAAIENLTAHGEISFDLLYAIFVPRSTLITKCPITNELQALQLFSATKVLMPCGWVYNLICEGVDVKDTEDPSSKGFYRYQTRVLISDFDGTVKINSLDAFPIQFFDQEKELREKLIARGKKWSELTGIHHRAYKGTAAFKVQGKIVKYNLNSRIMVDRANFRRINPNYAFPLPKPEVTVINADDHHFQRDQEMQLQNANLAGIPLLENKKLATSQPDLTEDELLIATPVVLGFSLADKLWLEFNIEKVQEIDWNPEAFENLILPSDRKMLLKSLVEAHNAELSGFDDFVKGKGRGLVVNLFGPPGVGKTLSAEATSEHVKQPLYIVGAGDLGTRAADLDKELQNVFDLATAWKAIVLLDEADVFCEARSLHELERNAMVAVFLRHLEYYPAILFMTTNRVKTFDEAFLSRIHISLHFGPLTPIARTHVWIAFLKKVGAKVGPGEAISDAELKKLVERDINGRQVKNAMRTANSLALSRGETIKYGHLVEVLDVMDDFATEFHLHGSGGMYN